VRFSHQHRYQPSRELIISNTNSNHAAHHIADDGRGARGYPAGVDFVDVVHYTLVGMVGLAALLTLWFAGYVVYRLHQD